MTSMNSTQPDDKVKKHLVCWFSFDVLTVSMFGGSFLDVVDQTERVFSLLPFILLRVYFLSFPVLARCL